MITQSKERSILYKHVVPSCAIYVSMSPLCFIFSRFNNSFLYLVGKVYKKINMDTFTPASELLLKEFRVLVSRSPLPIDSKRLVQVGQVSSSSPALVVLVLRAIIVAQW